MEKVRKTASFYIHHVIQSSILFAAIFFAISIILSLFHLRIRLWIWKIVAAVVCAGIIIGLIQIIFRAWKTRYRTTVIIAVAILTVLFAAFMELMFLESMIFFYTTESKITRAGMDYVMEVEQFDNTYVRFYPYKNPFLSGLISIKESYGGEASITYYDENGREIENRNCMSPESMEELWYYNQSR